MPVTRAVLFDLLTALIDSWSLWNAVAGGEVAGRGWRAAYLRRTYGAGAYRPYEALVREAALECGYPAAWASDLAARWDELEPWPGVDAALAPLVGQVRLGIVTNCSEVLGQRAAARVGVPFDVVITAERAGAYKPDPRPYRLALEQLGVDASETLFVAGSGYDLFGTAGLGLRTYWHNRIGAAAPAGAPAAWVESPDLGALSAALRSVN